MIGIRQFGHRFIAQFRRRRRRRRRRRIGYTLTL
jgi:hypothetical protein